jgi:4-diphosphocytidyl-2-C-methyl-D-erythritol kinase
MLRAFSYERDEVERIVLTAPAKVNLFLGIGALRPDGFHDVTTVLHALEFADMLQLTLADSFSLSCTEELGIPAEDNLAFRAARLFAEEFGGLPGVAIELTKRIPAGAGLAGGSSDAAAVLAGLAALTGREASDPRLVTLAQSLGADTAFFLEGGAALMTGRGDVIERRLPAVRVPVVIVKPASPVPTSAAYRAFDADPVAPGDPAAVIAALESADAPALGAALSNNMTGSAIALVPEVADALAWVSAESGVLGSAVAGSGSSVFAVCADERVARRIADEAPGRGLWGVATATRTTGVTWTE